MTGSKASGYRQTIWGLSRTLFLVQSLALAGGCTSATPDAAVLSCNVRIDGQPAADVRVMMLPKSQAEADSSTQGTLEGISDVLGTAPMRLVEGAQLSSDAEIDFRVAVESLGDWQIVPPWSDLQKSPLSVTWGGSEEPLRIEIPKKAIKPL